MPDLRGEVGAPVSSEMSAEEQNWLREALDRSVRERWCTNMNCTTCGTPEMRALLIGLAWRKGERHEGLQKKLTWERAESVVYSLRAIEFPLGYVDQESAVMWLLHAIWLQFGDRAHQELFPHLADSPSGRTLEAMREHYGRNTERNRLHDLRQGLKKKDWAE